MDFVLDLENFQGPFDLLLELLKKQKLEIAEISLEKITQNYLDYISGLDLGIDEMSSFLVVATKLVFNKSKAILMLEEDEVDFDLTESLLQYQQIKDQAMTISNLSMSPFISRVNPKATVQTSVLIDDQGIYNAYRDIIKNNSKKPKLQSIKNDKQQVLKMKNNFYKQILKLKTFTVNDALAVTANKKESVIYFVTILELIKNGRLKMFDDYIEVGAIA